jgi:hypothetical protein
MNLKPILTLAAAGLMIIMSVISIITLSTEEFSKITVHKGPEYNNKTDRSDYKSYKSIPEKLENMSILYSVNSLFFGFAVIVFYRYYERAAVLVIIHILITLFAFIFITHLYTFVNSVSESHLYLEYNGEKYTNTSSFWFSNALFMCSVGLVELLIYSCIIAIAKVSFIITLIVLAFREIKSNRDNEPICKDDCCPFTIVRKSELKQSIENKGTLQYVTVE